MNINIHILSMAIDVPVCTSVEDRRNAVRMDAELQMLQTYAIRHWLQNKDDMEPSL